MILRILFRDDEFEGSNGVDRGVDILERCGLNRKGSLAVDNTPFITTTVAILQIPARSRSMMVVTTVRRSFNCIL
jgi:hypothetical protein